MACLLLLSVAGVASAEIYSDFSGRISAESRLFPGSALHEGQRSHGSGLVALPSFEIEGDSGRSLAVEAFFRQEEGDGERSHADLREAYLLLLGDLGAAEWELRLGIDRVFWGVAESRHLVDIINQTDLVENPNEEFKLGQTMAHLTLSSDWGIAEFFLLPFHRKRTFPGTGGRLRPRFVVDQDLVRYESGAENKHVDLAFRYSHSVGPFDFGVSLFDGTAREPNLQLALHESGQPVLAPYYEQIRQYSLDAQMTTGPWLFKLEALHRSGSSNIFGEKDDFAAFVFGAEYTFYGMFGSAADIGVLAEWTHDARLDKATNFFQNDLFSGMRLGLNDLQGTELLFGVLYDMDSRSSSLYAEFGRRLAGNWSMRFETVTHFRVDPEDILYDTRNDSFVEFHLIYSF